MTESGEQNFVSCQEAQDEDLDFELIDFDYWSANAGEEFGPIVIVGPWDEEKAKADYEKAVAKGEIEEEVELTNDDILDDEDEV